MSHSSRDLNVKLNYFQWSSLFEKVKPYELLINVPKDVPITNFEIAPEVEETIRDVRGNEASFSLDQNGFVVRHQLSQVTSFDKSNVEEVYLKEMEELLTSELDDVSEIFFFDWRLRSSDPRKSAFEEGSYIDLADPLQHLQPAQAVHIDQSPWSAHQRVRHHMKNRAAELLQHRFRIINIWRPIATTVEDFPLALCDGGSLSADKLIAADHIRRDYHGESYYPLYIPGYRWYYLSRQTKDEVFLFKSYDSLHGVQAAACPHTSFKCPQLAEGSSFRESIEVRALVFSM